MLRIYVSSILLMTTIHLYAQVDFSYLQKMSEEDSSAVNALILYPKETRSAMFEVSLYPEALVRLHRLQTESSTSFTKLMAPLPKEDQEKFWEVVRYKGLVNKLTEGRRKSANEIEVILKDYPPDIHETALTLAIHQYEMLLKIQQQQTSFDHDFEALLMPYPARTQEAFRTLVQLPEVVNILQENISLVVLAGDAYRKNPDYIIRKTDSLSLEVARQNADDIKQWTKELEENPQAAEELKQSAKEYAREYGYDEDDYTEPKEVNTVEIHHYYDPYPYWCGSPWWYPAYWWYPYPYWYHWGFYFRDGGIIVFGLPSYFYVSWYFHYPIHHYYYPHLSDRYIYTYRHCHNTVSNSVRRAVDDWKTDRGNQLPDGLLNDDNRRAERLKEYGKFEEDYARYNLQNPNKSLSREDFYRKAEKSYPEIKYPEKEINRPNTDYQDDIYQQQYPTKKQVENKTFERNWDYPEKKAPERQYYPNKQVSPQQKAEPQRKVYPQNNTQPQKKFIPHQPATPKQQVPQRQPQPKINKVQPKTGGR